MPLNEPVRAPRPTPNPWIQEYGDYAGYLIRITVTWSATADANNRHAVTNVDIYRHPQCQYSRILIGTSLDGNPDDTDKVVFVPVGETSLTANQINVLRNRGAGTIEEILGFQITAGQ